LVYSFMYSSVACLTEFFATVTTFERLLACMHPHMNLNIERYTLSNIQYPTVQSYYQKNTFRFPCMKVMAHILLRRSREWLPSSSEPEPHVSSTQRCALYPPLSVNAPFYGYLKLLQATLNRKKSKQSCEVTRIRTPDLLHRRPRTNQLCHSCRLLIHGNAKNGVTCLVASVISICLEEHGLGFGESL